MRPETRNGAGAVLQGFFGVNGSLDVAGVVSCVLKTLKDCLGISSTGTKLISLPAAAF